MRGDFGPSSVRNHHATRSYRIAKHWLLVLQMFTKLLGAFGPHRPQRIASTALMVIDHQ